MKNILKSIILITILFATGCSDDFFDKTPQGVLDPSKIDASQIGNLRNAAYAQIDHSGLIFLEGYADNAYSRNWWDSHGALVQTNTVSAGEGFGYGIGNTDWLDFTNIFTGVRACNLLIDKIDEFDQIEDEIRLRYSAEAKVIRAMLYMKLTLFYGDVPIVEGVQNDFGEDGISRDPKSEVRAWVLKELDEAIVNLPVSNDVGRINKAVGYAVKARSAYYFGNYAEAKSASKYVIDNGGYFLNTVNYTDDSRKVKDAEFFRKMVDFSGLGINEEDFISGIFNYQNVFHSDDNPEVIFSKEYEPTEANGDFNRIAALLAPNLVGKEAWNIVAPIQSLVDDYWSADGKTKPQLAGNQTRINDFIALKDEIATIQIDNSLGFSEAVKSVIDDIPSKPYMSQFTNRDSRLYASIVFPFASISKYRQGNYNEYIPSIDNYGKTGFVWRKLGAAEDVVSIWGDSYFTSGLDFPLIRLAEMMLIFAESQTQVSGYDGSAATELNKLRQRCGMPNVPASMSKEEALDFIRRERRIELAGEGLRFYDIRLYEDNERNGSYKGEQAASAVMKNDIVDPAGNFGVTKAWAPRLLYMPIPTASMDKNPALVQNPGY